jgi:hypothetical protein
MARDVLAIPISTVASESAFSTGGRILDDFRSSLTPFMIEALVCSQDWLRRSPPTLNLVENTEEISKQQEGEHLFNISLLFSTMTKKFNVSFICCFLFSELIQEFKDLAIADGHAAKSQIQGSKRKMVTSTSISSQPSKSSNPSKSSKESQNNK